jgi:hypothetical protein
LTAYEFEVIDDPLFVTVREIDAQSKYLLWLCVARRISRIWGKWKDGSL